MHLRIALVDHVQRRPVVDLAVDAVPGATARDLRRAVLAIPGFDADASDASSWQVSGKELDDGALLGAPPLLEGVTIEIGAPTDATEHRVSLDSGGLSLAVTSGPDAGACWPLAPGEHRIGRAAEASVRIEDPSLSRVHLLVDVRSMEVLVSDPSSTNGSFLGGDRLGSRPRPWRVGTRLRVGSTTLELRVSRGASVARTYDGLGHVLVNRAPRLRVAAEPVIVRLPAAPAERQPGRIPLLAMVVPMVVALPMAAVLRSPTYLLFGLMSPAMMLGNLLSDRRGGRRDHRRELAAFERATTRARADLAGALAIEGVARRTALPDAAELLETGRMSLFRLWERRREDNDALTLRIGVGTLPAATRLLDPAVSDTPAPQPISDVPVGIDLSTVGVLGVSGDEVQLGGMTRALVAQIAGWHSPRDVRVVVLLGDSCTGQDWSWATLLPHLRSEAPERPQAEVASSRRPEQIRQRVGELVDLLGARLELLSPAAPMRRGVRIVLIVDGADRLRTVPGFVHLLESGPQVGIHTICLATRPDLLPTECGAVVELSQRIGGPSGCTIRSSAGEAPVDVVPDLVSAAWAEQFARAMAPLRDATPDKLDVDIPEQARLLDLLGDNATNPLSIAERWLVEPSSTNVVVGVTADGVHCLDLRVDGPHVLIGGTTGSGKSELLQTIIASLALANSPEHLGFVLVDYKGGSAFEECAHLPHTLGVVTDLDPYLTERALLSMTAELRRRETLLRNAGAKDLDDYVARTGPAGPALARLVLVIDEFRMLADELPAFMAGMVRIAAVGRSLGVHLVLATQRPAGIVSADIAANVNLRIALRVRDQIDSEDVIESRAAAAISERTPGRAYARAGSNPLVLFQSARVAGRSAGRAVESCVVKVLEWDSLGDLPLGLLAQADERPFGHDGNAGDPPSRATDLARIVGATRTAVAAGGLPPQPSPWLPPLPELVTLADLADNADSVCAPYGVVDLPETQSQVTVAWDLARDAHLGIAGRTRSGRTTLLRTLAGSLAARHSTDEVHLHVIDGGSGGLLGLARLPHAGVVTGTDDVPRGVRLLDLLVQEISRRQRILGSGGYGSLAEQHAHVSRMDRLPYVVLLIDGWESVAAAWESVDHGRPAETLGQLLRDGASVGLRVAIAGDRGLLLSRLSSSLRDKVALRLADPTDLVLAGVPTSKVPAQMPPGRGLRVTDHAEVQVAVLSTDPSGPAQIAALDGIAATARRRAVSSGPPGHPLLRIETLPELVFRAQLDGAHNPASPGWVLVGRGGDSAHPVGLALAGSSALVAGPPGSGRSTALVTIGLGLAGQGAQLVAVAAGHSALNDLSGNSSLLGIFDEQETDGLRDRLTSHPDCTVLIDDVERLLDSEMEDVVLQWFKSMYRRAGALVVAGSSAEMAGMFRGLSVVARRSGQGVLLNPTSYADGDLLGVRIGTTDAAAPRPGRGLLVSAGATTPVQVAQ